MSSHSSHLRFLVRASAGSISYTVTTCVSFNSSMCRAARVFTRDIIDIMIRYAASSKIW
jgi:hypothetical protein